MPQDSRSRLGQVLKPACKRPGLPLISWHSFRHTHATLHFFAGPCSTLADTFGTTPKSQEIGAGGCFFTASADVWKFVPGSDNTLQRTVPHAEAQGLQSPMLNRFRIIAAFLCLVVCVSASWAQRRSVALTFDDLPVVGTVDPAEARSINISILGSLDRQHAPAIGFVIESRVEEIGKLQGQELLRQWVERGYELGNHTYSHTISDNLTADQFEDGIVAGEASFAAALNKVGKAPRYFRFPQSHTGDTKEKHDAIAAFLVQRHYKVAVCTIDNEDYAFNAAYVKMLSSNDDASAAKLRADYLAYTSAEIDYYSGLHKQIFGREIPHVMLLHVNRLNADLIDQLLELFIEKRYRFVTLDVALSDPAYSTPDSFVPRFSKFGPMWGYRWAAELGVGVNGALESEPPAWVLTYGKARK
jgi:peptidoglycan/xylan/chitin deacetylase (PgdA/CDA1 family)